MKKFIISSAIITAMAIPVAFAAGMPSVNIPTNENTQQSVSLNNISNDVKNLQVTINLSKEQDYDFLENSILSNKVGVEFFYKTGNSSVTIYITSNTDVLTTSGNLILGTISADNSFNIASATNMKVTDGTNTSDSWESIDTQTPSNGNNTGSNNNNSNTDNNKPETTLPFTDVSEKDWYYEAVKYVYDNALMSGVSDKTFAPNANTTRGMIVTVLYRLENEPDVNIDNSFNDVKPSDYYANAIYWAKKNNIVTGYNSTTFAPNDNITREQMATILYRYAAYKGYSIDKTSDLSGFTDVSNINDYALKPIKWAVSSNLISGMGDSTISPQGNASRAQIATILMRFIENL